MSKACTLCETMDRDSEELLPCKLFRDARRAPRWLRERCLIAGQGQWTGMRVEQKIIGNDKVLVTVRDATGIPVAWAEGESRYDALWQLLSAERYRERYGLGNDTLVKYLEGELQS
jgi:hypothetical protein